MSRDIDTDDREVDGWNPEPTINAKVEWGLREERAAPVSSCSRDSRNKPDESALSALREIVDQAAEGHPSVSEFLDRLEEQGVRPVASVQSDGHWNGMVYEYEGARIKGSHLGRAYTAKGLQQRRGVHYQPDRDDDRLARSSSCSRSSITVSRDRGDREVRDLDRSTRFRDASGISPAERAVLWDVGRFRTVAVSDLEQARYHGRESLLRQDIKHLRAEDYLERRTVAIDGRGGTIKVLSLTREGKALLKETARDDREHGQALYSGFVKPREIAHDAAIYRMYQAEAERIERQGGQVRRVILDYELKKRAYSPLAKAQDLPASEYAIRKQEIADENGLAVVDGHIVLPDLRIEYETREGEERHIDLELATRNYRAAHIRSKAAAGFRLYANSSSGALSTVLDDHHLTAELLDF